MSSPNLLNVFSRRFILIAVVAVFAAAVSGAEWSDGESRSSRSGATALLRDGTGGEWAGLTHEQKRSLARRYLVANGRYDLTAGEVLHATDAFVADFGPDFTSYTPMRALMDFAVDAAEERAWALASTGPPAAPALAPERERSV